MVAVLAQIQTLCGRECPAMTDQTKPIGHIDGFDSLLAVEATVMLEQVLERTLSQGTAFISADGKKALSVSEIVDRVVEMACPREAV